MKNLVFSIYICTIILCSCSKSQKELEHSFENNWVKFILSGVADYQKNELLANSKLFTAEDVSLQTPYEKIELDRNTIFVSSETHSLAQDKKNFNQKVAATSLLESGLVYRVLIYEKSGSDWKFYKYQDIISGQNSPANNTVKLILGKQYKWVAYSYGTNSITDEAPSLGSTTAPQIQTKHDSPTLYCSGAEFTNSSDITSQNVLFVNKTSKIEVVVDTRGLFTDNGAFVKEITSSSAQLLADSKVTTASLDLFTGNWASVHEVATGYSSDIALDLSTNLVDLDGFDKTQVYTSARLSANAIYTSLSPHDATFSVNLTGLSVRKSIGFSTDADMDSVANIADGTTVNLINSSNEKLRSFNSPITTNEVGKILRLNFRFGDSGVLLNDTYWTKGNLYFRTTGSGSTAHGEYRIDRVRKTSTAFKEENTSPLHYFWRYNKLYPFNFTQGSENDDKYHGDACARLHPKGVWRSPTKSDFINLVNNSTAIQTPPPGALIFERYITSATANNHLVIRIGSGTESPINEYLYLNAIGFYFSNGVHANPAEEVNYGLEINTLNNPFEDLWGFKVYFSNTGTNRFSLLENNGVTSPITYTMNNYLPNDFGTDSGHALRCVRQ